MYPYIHIILPSYTVMAFIGGFLALILIYIRLEKYNLEFSSFLRIFMICVIGGFIGSKVLFAITQIPWLIQNFSLKNLLLLLPQSGFVFYGGLFGVIFALYIQTRKDNDLRIRVFRLAVPAMPLFHALGRIGCFLSGCCYGKELIEPIIIGGLEFTRIPVQLIESFAEFIIFLIIMVLENKKPESDFLKAYLLLYAAVRFADEFFRGDKVRGIYFGISTAQWISIAIIIFYIGQFIKKHKKILI